MKSDPDEAQRLQEQFQALQAQQHTRIVLTPLATLRWHPPMRMMAARRLPGLRKRSLLWTVAIPCAASQGFGF